MATVIEISKTNHLTFSPLNQKHNILYHRARQNVNQRHIQKPWFDLNPFLDKTDDKHMDLETYNPVHDRGVHPLESLTIVEDFCSDKPLMSREFKIGEFWDFLFSGDWADGCSLRVLEGRLQNMIFTCLVKMTQSRVTVQHSTRAFAKNRRKRYAIYKLSTKPPEICSHEETLLLEFIYYGHALSTKLPTLGGEGSSGSSSGYARATTCSTVISISTDLESSEQDLNELTQPQNPMLPSPPKPPKPQLSVFQRYRTLPSNPGRRERKAPINKSLSRAQDTSGLPSPTAMSSQGVVPKIPRGTWRKEHRSDVSSGSDDFYPQSLDLSKFMCTEKVEFLGEFDLTDDSSSSSSEDEDCDFGQTLYLGERAVLEPACSSRESVETRLKKRKHIIKQQREERRKLLEQQNRPPKPLFPEFSELDVNKYLSTTKLTNVVKPKRYSVEKVPDLEEYIEMLQKEELSRVRARKKARQKLQMQLEKKEKKKEPNNQPPKPGLERFADIVGTVTASRACRLHCYNADREWGAMPDEDKRNFLIQKLIKAGFGLRLQDKAKKAKKESKRRRRLQIPLIYITTVKQITYLAPVSRPLFMELMRQGELENGKYPMPTGRRRASLLPTDHGALTTELNKKRRGSVTSPKPGLTEETETITPVKLLFPKAPSFVSGTESPDNLSDEEDDGLAESPFDTHKLHMQYSLERIRKTKAERKHRRIKEMGQSDFMQVLKKYYRMRSVLKAFTPRSRRKSAAGVHHSIVGVSPIKKQTPQRMNTCNLLPEIEKPPELVVGKMKHFSFLDAKSKLFAPVNDEEHPIEQYPMALFYENLSRALNEFVVRRELVISDYNAKVSVSITFTKKSVFVKSRMQSF